jgi:hypothetical protein
MTSKTPHGEDNNTDPRLLLLSPDDNVLVVLGTIKAGEQVLVEGKTVTAQSRIVLAHKMARLDISQGTKIIKYGAPIGSATCNITCGDHVHLKNIKSDYTATHSLEEVST